MQITAPAQQQRCIVACHAQNQRHRARSATIVRATSQHQPAKHLAGAAASCLTAASLLVPGVAHADALVGSDVGLAVGGGAAIAALGAALVATDPQKRYGVHGVVCAGPSRTTHSFMSSAPVVDAPTPHAHRRSAQMSETGGDEKEAVRSYFNTAGFERWNKIYGETDEVNKVSECIRRTLSYTNYSSLMHSDLTSHALPFLLSYTNSLKTPPPFPLHTPPKHMHGKKLGPFTPPKHPPTPTRPGSTGHSLRPRPNSRQGPHLASTRRWC